MNDTPVLYDVFMAVNGGKPVHASVMIVADPSATMFGFLAIEGPHTSGVLLVNLAHIAYIKRSPIQPTTEPPTSVLARVGK